MWIRTTNGIEFIPLHQTSQGVFTIKTNAHEQARTNNIR